MIYRNIFCAGRLCMFGMACLFLTFSATSTFAQTPIINEFLASNTTTNADAAGEFDDWIEIYNPTLDPISMLGYYLTDTSTNLLKYDFPDTTLHPGAYMLIWADEDGQQAGLHANFKLSASNGEQIYLYDSLN
ncbi:MAG: lamin tail domain-containing protein, partial [Bacteroidota bacterium]